MALVSIRSASWTVGDLGSLATSVGVIVHFLAATPTIQQQVRTLVDTGDRAALAAAVEEILRADRAPMARTGDCRSVEELARSIGRVLGNPGHDEWVVRRRR